MISVLQLPVLTVLVDYPLTAKFLSAEEKQFVEEQRGAVVSFPSRYSLFTPRICL